MGYLPRERERERKVEAMKGYGEKARRKRVLYTTRSPFLSLAVHGLPRSRQYSGIFKPWMLTTGRRVTN